MQRPSDPSGRLRFGVFEVDLRAGELTRRGLRVRLQEQPFQVLAMLLERPGEVVTREELQKKLWGQTVVDFDHGLNKAINKIREALGDSAENPRFVETVARRGYRFLAEATPIDTTRRQPDPEIGELAQPTFSRRGIADAGLPSTRPRRTLVWAGFGFGLVLVLTASLAWILNPKSQGMPKIRCWRSCLWKACRATRRRTTSPMG